MGNKLHLFVHSEILIYLLFEGRIADTQVFKRCKVNLSEWKRNSKAIDLIFLFVRMLLNNFKGLHFLQSTLSFLQKVKFTKYENKEI